jgi:hypothetical protein
VPLFRKFPLRGRSCWPFGVTRPNETANLAKICTDFLVGTPPRAAASRNLDKSIFATAPVPARMNSTDATGDLTLVPVSKYLSFSLSLGFPPNQRKAGASNRKWSEESMALSLRGISPRVWRSCPNARHTNEPVRILTMYDGQLTPPRYGTSVRISFV